MEQKSLAAFNQRGVLGLTGIALGTAFALAALQQLLLATRPSLTAASKPILLNRSARLDPDPIRRREARLILATQQPNQLDLLRGQGWGRQGESQLLAPISLKLEALALAHGGQEAAAQKQWQYLVSQFPKAPPSADGLYALGQAKELLQRFPAHPAALAAALKWQQKKAGSLGGLHLARYGKRWPGAAAAMAEACMKPERALAKSEKTLLATGLLAQGDRAAAQRCLGKTKIEQIEPKEQLSASTKAWERSRELLLKRQWARAYNSLSQLQPNKQSPPIAARSRFWMGLSAWQQGQKDRARAIWQNQLRQYPYGYYAWRASVRLAEKPPLPAQSGPGPLPAPLAKLRGLGLHTEAWEHWRTWRLGRAAVTPTNLWQEGQLRLAVGDRWLGLAQLDSAALEGAAGSKAQQALLEQQRHPLTYGQELGTAARRAGLDPLLLQGVARQESRLNTTVRSPAGAVGLLQLMPATAAELAGEPLTTAALEEANLNARLGGSYLKQMLGEFGGNIFLAVASYNAGPGAVKSWPNNNLQDLPELWVEQIPYPETRIYVKSVLGNYFSYQQLSRQRI